MNGKLGAFGLAFVVVFAMAALPTATASAEQVHIGTEHATIKVVNFASEDVFTTNAGTVKCARTEHIGTTTTSTPSSISVVPTYKECIAFGFVNTTIDVPSGCEYRFNTPLSTTSTVDIVGCPAFEPIRVTAFNCWVAVENQSGLNHVVWSNVPGGALDHVHAVATVAGIKYTQASKSFPGCTNGTFTNGSYSATDTVRAFDTSGIQVNLTVT